MGLTCSTVVLTWSIDVAHVCQYWMEGECSVATFTMSTWLSNKARWCTYKALNQLIGARNPVHVLAYQGIICRAALVCFLLRQSLKVREV